MTNETETREQAEQTPEWLVEYRKRRDAGETPKWLESFRRFRDADETEKALEALDPQIKELGAKFMLSVVEQVEEAMSLALAGGESRLKPGAWEFVIGDIVETVMNRLYEYKPVFGGDGWFSPADDVNLLSDEFVEFVDDEYEEESSS
jgi:hypothetical protein